MLVVRSTFTTVQQVIAIHGMLRMTYKDVVQFRIVKWVNGYTGMDRIIIAVLFPSILSKLDVNVD